MEDFLGTGTTQGDQCEALPGTLNSPAGLAFNTNGTVMYVTEVSWVGYCRYSNDILDTVAWHRSMLHARC